MSQPRFLADEDLRGDIVRAVRRMAPEVMVTTVFEQDGRRQRMNQYLIVPGSSNGLLSVTTLTQ